MQISGKSRANLRYISCKSHTYLRNIAHISQEYCTHISDKYKSYFRTISVISRAYLRHIFGISWVNLRCITNNLQQDASKSLANLMQTSVKFMAYPGHISSFPWTCHRKMCGKSQAYIRSQKNLRHISSIKAYLFAILIFSIASVVQSCTC